MKPDIKRLGIPNVCFSCNSKKHKKRFKRQRIKRGFDDSETWSLRDTIAKFIIPRLKRYEVLADKIIYRDQELKDNTKAFLTAMELVEEDCIDSKEKEEQLVKGLEAFPKIFMSLWW